MKLREIFWIWKKPHFKKKMNQGFGLKKNDIEIENLKINNSLLHSHTYDIIRKMKTPQYNSGWVMRNKKGFNTVFFNINYDIVMCDSFGNIINLFPNTKTGYVSKHYPNSYFIYFFVVGTIKDLNIEKGERLTLKRQFVNFTIFQDAVGI